MSEALKRQIKGNHYKDLKIQPVEYIHANNLGFCEGSVVKYISRWRNKNGLEDLEKAKQMQKPSSSFEKVFGFKFETQESSVREHHKEILLTKEQAEWVTKNTPGEHVKTDFDSFKQPIVKTDHV